MPTLERWKATRQGNGELSFERSELYPFPHMNRRGAEDLARRVNEILSREGTDDSYEYIEVIDDGTVDNN